MRAKWRILRKRITAWMLVAAMAGNMAAPAFGYPKNKTSGLTVEGKNGEKITEDDSWKERFPNGTFAFKKSYMYLHEGKTENLKITVYRLGGTKGEAVANICVTPAVTQNTDGSVNEAYAAGYEDFTIEIDMEGKTDVKSDSVESASSSNASGIRSKSASSSNANSSDKGSSGSKGKKKLDTSEMDPYDPLYFDLEFKDGEYAKDIIVNAIDDDLPETMEFALFTIYDCQGAEFTEAANGMSLGIYDDEKPVDSQVGFTVSKVRADKSSGQAVLTVTRTGGVPYVAQCGFRTSDQTAKAGRDYARQEGVVTFAGGVDETEIVIELIDDKIITEETVSFQVELYDPKAAVIDPKAKTITVDLYNSGEQHGTNLATMLYTPDADDVSGGLSISKKAVIETEEDPEVEVTTPEQTFVEADYSPGFGAYNPRQRTVDFGALSLPANSGKWKDIYEPMKEKASWSTDANKSEYSAAYDSSNRWTLKNKAEARTMITIEDLYERYSLMEAAVALMTDTRGNNIKRLYNTSYAYLGGPVDKLTDLPGDGADALHAYMKTIQDKELVEHADLGINTPYVSIFGIQSGNNKESFDNKNYQYSKSVKLAQLKNDAVKANQYDTYNKSRSSVVGMIETQTDDKITGGVRFDKLALTRIPLGTNPKVLLHTADDGEFQRSVSNTQIQKIMPAISLDGERGGVNAQGKLYIGSTLNIANNTNAGIYSIYGPVFLADNASGKILSKSGGGNQTTGQTTGQTTSQTLELGIDPALGLNRPLMPADNLSVNVIMNRTQNVSLNYTPSYTGPKDTAATKTAVETRLQAVLANAVYTYSYADDKKIGTESFASINEDKKDLYFTPAKGTGKFTLNSGNSEFLLSGVQNLKTINFNLSADDCILYNGKRYNGNETIVIDPMTYSNQVLSFSFYDKEHINEIVKMDLTITGAVTYLDQDGDGVLDDGERTALPYQTLAKDEYLITDLAPVETANGRKQQILEITYSMNPRCLVVPSGKSATDQCEIVPNLVTTVTSEEVKAKLTPEMRGYRQIMANSNKKYMYGDKGVTDSTGTISFPLGGDLQPAVYNKQQEKYSWDPDWLGKPAKKYDNPQKIVLDDTAMPNGFVAAEGKDKVNAYLGSMHGDDSFALLLCYDEKVSATETVRKTDDTEKGTFKTIPEKGSTTVNLDKKDASVDTTDRPSKQPNLTNSEPAMELPSINLPAGPLAFVTSEDTLGVTLGIPLVSHSKDNSVKSNQETNDGTRNTYTESKESINQMKELLDFSKGSKDNIFQKLKDYKNTNTGDLPGVKGGNTKPARKAFEIASSISMSFMWQYSKITNKFEFQSAGIYLNVGGSVTIKKYLDVCPIVYCFITFGAEMDAGMGLEIEETVDKDGKRNTEVQFSGVDISLTVFLEAGAGLGIEVLSAEIFVRGSVTVGFILGQEGQDFEINKFVTRAAVGFRVVLLAISYEMEAISIEVGYKDNEKKEKEWYFKWTYFGQEGPGSSKNRSSFRINDGDVPGFKIKLPNNTYYEEGIYTPEDNLPPNPMQRAIDVPDMPFQVSGYSKSAAAAKLADGISLGSKYRLLTVDKGNNQYEHYVLYMASRPADQNAEGIHANALMLSKLEYVETNTGEDPDASSGEKTLGLVHPTDPDNQDPYLMLDDDIYGDVDFGGSATGGKLHIVWTSYTADASAAVEEYEKNSDDPSASINMMSGLSGHTKVKSTVIDPNQTGQKHTVVTLATASNAMPYRYLPQPVNEKTGLFVQTVPYTKAELEALRKKYEEYYQEDNTGNAPGGGTSQEGDPYAQMKYEYRINMASVYGKSAGFGVAVEAEDGSTEFNVFTLENWEKASDVTVRIDEITTLATSSNAAYVAYATTEEKIPEGSNSYEDILYTKKLFLQKVEFPGENGAVAKWGTPKLLQTLAYSENGTVEAGVYGNDGAIDSHTDGAFFANLKFLKAKVRNKGAENIFLFNMNGDTYYISEDDMDEILESSNPKVEIVPIFSLEDEDNKKVNTQNDVTISVDPKGELVAVYADQVPSTTNNALYISRYDSDTETWSDKVMLAMSQMQVYEDSLRFGWDETKTSESYYLDDDGNLRTDASKFVMSAPEVALGVDDEKEQLVVMFQGVTTPLNVFYCGVDENGDMILQDSGENAGNVETQTEKDDTFNILQAIPSSDPAKRVTTGFYTLAYGVGERAIGDARLTFLNDRFIPGATLQPNISFKNTGDVALRGSEAQPIQVALHIADPQEDAEGHPANDTVLANWEIKGIIPAGRMISVTDAAAIDNTLPLPAGDLTDKVLYFTVNEDKDYFNDGAYHYSSYNEPEGGGRIQITERPELVLSDFSASVSGDPKITENGLSIPVNVKMTIQNAGTKAADGINLKIGYTKTDEDGKSVFHGIGSTGKFGSDYSLKDNGDGTFELLKDGKSVTLAAGGIGTAVLTGDFQVTQDCFDNSGEVKGMRLSCEVSTGEEEYDLSNNSVYSLVKTDTVFGVPSQMNLSVNTPVTIFANAVVMDNSAPQIAVEELQIDGSDRILENVSFNAINGTMTLVPKKEKGSGIVRISDAQTGSYHDIAVTVLDEGVNIRTDNTLLSFGEKAKWKDTYFPPGAVVEKRPYMDDTSTGTAGGSFTFDTYADHIDLYFEGSAKVSSVNDFGFADTTVTGTDLYKPTEIAFGNSGLKKHTVTVTVISTETSATATFDRYVEHYTVTEVPWKKDKAKPVILLGKSIPENNSLKPGEIFEMPVYVFDDRNLSEVFLNGDQVSYETEGFAWGTVKISQNGTYRISAKDGSGNKTESPINAENWFDGKASGVASEAWPKIGEVYLSDADGAQTASGKNLTAEYDKGTAKIESWNAGTVGETLNTAETGTQNPKKATTVASVKEGFYLVTVKGDDGTWSRKLHCVSSTGGPKLEIREAANDGKMMFYLAGEEGKAALAEIKIYAGAKAEGTPIVSRTDFNGASFASGQFPKASSGTYFMTATDIDGKTSEYLYSPDALLKEIKIGQDLLEDFRPATPNYEVWIPYGTKAIPEVTGVAKTDKAAVTYPEKATAFEEGKNVTKIRVSENNTNRTYTVKFLQEKCTCEIRSLTFNDVYVPVGWNQDKGTVTLSASADVTNCTVEDHKDQKVVYEYKLKDGGTGGASVSGNVLTCTDTGSGTVEVTAHRADGPAKTETAAYESVKKIRTEVTVSDRDKARNSGIAYVRTEMLTPQKEAVVDKNTSLIIGPSRTVDVEEPEQLDETAITLPEANEGYMFDHWKVGDVRQQFESSGDKEFKLTADTNRTITAYFKDIESPECSITVKEKTWKEFLKGITFGLFFKESTEAEIKATDNDQVEKLEYLIADREMTDEELAKAAWTAVDAATTETVSLDPDQKAVLYARATDRDGNMVIVNSDGIVVDATNPDIHLPSDMTEFSNKAVDIRVQTGDNLAGIETVTYRTDETAPQTGTVTVEQGLGVIRMENEGDYMLTVTAKDKSGNEQTASTRIRIDLTDPKLTLPPDMTEFSNEAVDIPVKVSDNLAGVETVMYTTDEAKPQTGTVTVTNGAGTVQMKNEGDYTLTVTARDKSGNEQTASTRIKIDLTDPKLTLPPDMTEFSNKVVDIPVKVSDNLAGVQTVTYTTNEAEPQTGTVIVINGAGTVRMKNEGDYVLTVTVKDSAGNEHSDSTRIKIDLTDPELRITGQSGKAQVPYYVDIEASDRLAALKQVTYKKGADDTETVITLENGKARILLYKRDDFVLSVKAVDMAGNETVVQTPIALALHGGGSGGSSGGGGGSGGSGSGKTKGPGKDVQKPAKRLYLSDGSIAANVWVLENGVWYRAGADGYALTGWFKDPIDGYWYYLQEDPQIAGAMATGWVFWNGGFYYLNQTRPQTSGWKKDPETGNWEFIQEIGVSMPLGAMYSNATTPDGYRVDASGKWIQE